MGDTSEGVQQLTEAPGRTYQMSDWCANAKALPELPPYETNYDHASGQPSQFPATSSKEPVPPYDGTPMIDDDEAFAQALHQSECALIASMQYAREVAAEEMRIALDAEFAKELNVVASAGGSLDSAWMKDAER